MVPTPHWILIRMRTSVVDPNGKTTTDDCSEVEFRKDKSGELEWLTIFCRAEVSLDPS